MPPRLHLLAARSAAPIFRQSASQRYIASTFRHSTKPALQYSVSVQQRWNSSNSNDKPLEDVQRQAESMPHVSEEAAEISKIMDKKCDGTPASPELEQGTPVSEILSRDKEARKHAPKVFQDQLNKGPSGSRSFSTSARRPQLQQQGQGAGSSAADQASAALVESMISQVTSQAAEAAMLPPGLKFPAPATLPKTENYKTRYDSVLEQFTKQIMKDGKLARAQKRMSAILEHLHASPPPAVHPRRRLLSDGATIAQLPLDPIRYLTVIVDSIAPLIANKSVSGIAGGGASVNVPVPLALRQRRRFAIRWIIDASDKRRDIKFETRVANELLAAAEGRSSAWEKKELVYKLGVAGRVNVGKKPRKGSGGR